MLRIATCLIAASLVAGSIAPASAQTPTKPTRMQKLKEMKAKWSANRPKLKACKVEVKKKGLTGDDRWFYISECMERN
jgi:Ni/Co efflux regulator RcnB